MRTPRAAAVDFIGAFICGALVVLFSLILLWRDPLAFWIDDYQISILPVFDDVARSWSDGQWPLLSPYSWICGNLAGEYQYGTFSVFINVAVVVIWKLFHGFAHQAAALSIVHLVVLALGGFFLARQRDLSLPLATMVSLVTALNGWIIAWGASDWFGSLGAFAWLPWAWWGMEKALSGVPNVALTARQCSEKDHRRAADATQSAWRFLWPAPFVYLVATGGFPYTVGMLGLLIVWLTIRSWVQTKSLFAPLPMFLGAALGFGMALPAFLALFDCVHGSAREAQPASAHWQWIVPPTALPGFFLPSWTVKWADFSTRYVPHTGTELACGLVAPAAVLWGLIFRTRLVVQRMRWRLTLLGFVLVIAMLPTAGLFRWSFRWLPLFHLILALCAAETLALLGKREIGDRSPRSPISLPVFVFFTVALIAAAMKVFHIDGIYFLPLTVVLLVLAAIWTVVEFLLLEGRSPASPVHAELTEPPASQLRPPPPGSFGLEVRAWTPAFITFASLLATYLCVPPNAGVPRFYFTDSLKSIAPLNQARLYLSVYPPPELAYRMEAWPEPVGQTVRPGSTSMWAQLHFINGYSPIRPAGIARRLYSSIHGEIDPGTAEWMLSQEAGPQGGLARLGVDGIIIARGMDFNPEPANEWELVTSTREGRVFHRRHPPFERVRSVETLPSWPNRKFVSATISDISVKRNRVEASVEVPEGNEPALVAFSRPYFDGYQAALGGTRLRVGSDDGVYPVVELPAGSHGRLVLQYRPAWLVYGGLTGLGCAALFLTSSLAALRNSIKSRG